MHKRLPPSLAALPAVLLLGGCVAAGDVRPYPAMAPIVPVGAPVAAATPGAIYQAGPGLSLYADRVARDVGDMVTITLVESTTAQTSASTQVAKNSEIGIAAPAPEELSPAAKRFLAFARQTLRTDPEAAELGKEQA